MKRPNSGEGLPSSLLVFLNVCCWVKCDLVSRDGVTWCLFLKICKTRCVVILAGPSGKPKYSIIDRTLTTRQGAFSLPRPRSASYGIPRKYQTIKAAWAIAASTFTWPAKLVRFGTLGAFTHLQGLRGCESCKDLGLTTTYGGERRLRCQIPH